MSIRVIDFVELRFAPVLGNKLFRVDSIVEL